MYVHRRDFHTREGTHVYTHRCTSVPACQGPPAEELPQACSNTSRQMYFPVPPSPFQRTARLRLRLRNNDPFGNPYVHGASGISTPRTLMELSRNKLPRGLSIVVVDCGNINCYEEVAAARVTMCLVHTLTRNLLPGRVQSCGFSGTL